MRILAADFFVGHSVTKMTVAVSCGIGWFSNKNFQIPRMHIFSIHIFCEFTV